MKDIFFDLTEVSNDIVFDLTEVLNDIAFKFKEIKEILFDEVRNR